MPGALPVQDRCPTEVLFRMPNKIIGIDPPPTIAAVPLPLASFSPMAMKGDEEAKRVQVMVCPSRSLTVHIVAALAAEPV